MTIYSAQLAIGTVSGPGNFDVYTAPSGMVVVVRDMSLMCDDTGSDQCLVRVVGKATVWSATSAGQYDVAFASRRLVLEPGDVIQLGVGAGSWEYSFSGYIFSS